VVVVALDIITELMEWAVLVEVEMVAQKVLALHKMVLMD
jgi:hypothetical protein